MTDQAPRRRWRRAGPFGIAAFGLVLAGGVGGYLVASDEEPGPEASRQRDVPTGWNRCTNPVEGYAIAYPAGWHTAHLAPAHACAFFDPKPVRIVGGSEFPATNLEARPASVDGRSFKQVLRAFVDPMFERTVTRRAGSVAGRRAIILETEATGAGLYERGARTYAYLIDRDGEAFVVKTTAFRGDDYRAQKAIVDRALATLRLPGPRVRVFFSNRALQANDMSCGEVFPVARAVAGGLPVRERVAHALSEVLEGPTPAERRAGYSSWFSSATAGRLRGVRISPDGVVRVDFEDFSRVIPNASTSCGSAALLATLDATVRDVLPQAKLVYSFAKACAAFYDWLQLATPDRCRPMS